MITGEPTQKDFDEWKATWEKYKLLLKPNRKTGAELLAYLQSHYTLTEISDTKALGVVVGMVTMNGFISEKLPDKAAPVPRAFYLENAGEGEKFYRPENKDDANLWGGDVTRIFLGLDMSSGFCTVEGSTLLWDEICAFQGVDEKDLCNYVIVAQYIKALKRFGMLERVIRR